MKKQFTSLFLIAIVVLGFSFSAYSQITLGKDNFPSPNDSIRVLPYMIAATQNFTDDDPKNDTLSLEQTLEKAIYVNNTADGMSKITKTGYREDTVVVFYYQGFAKSPYIRKYNPYNTFTPGASQFPTANIHTLISTSEGDAHTYLLKDDSGIYELGFYSVTSEGAMTAKNDPKKPMALFPVSYTNPNNASANIVTSVTTSAAAMTITTTLKITVDAYGKLTLVDGNMTDPTIKEYPDFIRIATHSEDNIDLGGGTGMNLFVKSKIYSYYVPGLFEPLVTYSVAQIRSNIDPMYWSMAGKWEDELDFQYVKKIIPSAIPENEAAFFNIFPNPTNGPVEISFEKLTNEKVSVEIYSMYGQLVDSFNADDNQIVRFNMDHLAKGTYIVNLNIDNKVFSSKVVKQ